MKFWFHILVKKIMEKYGEISCIKWQKEIKNATEDVGERDLK